ncbi:MAG: peptidoglycan binding domain-containing protein, partial [Clostridia bacterium]|nr:peptidoglycan binding domain-containing protein [Clostridia bacterium]
MKKLFILAIICVIFVGTASVPQCFCLEEIVFLCGKQEFVYTVDKNIKKSNNFYEEFELNKYNRFGTMEQKRELLEHMLNLGFETRVAVEYLYPNISKTINKIERTVNVQERDANLKIDTNTNKVFIITPQVIGKRVNTQQIYEDLAQ